MKSRKSPGQGNQQTTASENPQAEDKPTLDLEYLQLAMDLLWAQIRVSVHAWSHADQDPGDPIRGLTVKYEEAKHLLERKPFSYWGTIDSLIDKDRKILDHQLEKAKLAINQFTRRYAETPPLLLRLLKSFNLSSSIHVSEQVVADTQVVLLLLLCIAPEIDTSVEQLYGYLQDNVARRRASIQLIFKILSESGVKQLRLAQYFAPQHPFIKYRIFEVGADPNLPWLHQQVRIDETVLAWLLGYYRPANELTDAASLDAPNHLLAKEGIDSNHLFADIVLPEADKGRSLSNNPLILFYGRNRFAQHIAAYRFAMEKSRPLLTVALDKVIATGCPPLRAVQLALRDARITEAILFCTGWDACLAGDNRISTEISQALGEHPGTVIIASDALWHLQDNKMARPCFSQEFSISGFEERKKQWRYFLDGPSPYADQLKITDELLDKVARSFSLESASIRDAAYLARSIMVHKSAESSPEDSLFTAARAYASPNLGTLAKRVELRRHEWDDLILEETQKRLLCEMKNAIQNRQKVLKEWGVGRRLASSEGIVALFVGTSGTGKTLAAQIIANALGYPLYKIDLAMVVSKYIGETEKHLRSIFDEAASTNAILFFDEADSLFGKRTDIREAHDRFANQEVSDLLQRIESYDGVAILATNLLGNIDDAFKRRLQFIIDFPFPTVEERRKLWGKLLESTCIPGKEKFITGSKLVADLAQHELSGGNIRNAIITATYQMAECSANELTLEHLRHGIDSELQKIGRLVSYAEFNDQ